MFIAPLSGHPRKLEIIRQFTPNWFTVTMGTGVLALVLAPYRPLYPLAEIVWATNIALFILCVGLYVTRWILFPAEASRIFSHPVMPMFLGAIPMGLATIINGSVVFAHAYAVALPLWLLDAALSIAAGLAVPFAMITLQRHALERMTAVWLLPVVACEVAAASAGGLAGHVPPPLALNLVMAGYALWALSVPVAFSILTVLFLRLVLHKLPPPEMGVSSWLAVGPLGTGALGLLVLGHAAPAAFAAAGLGPAGLVAQGLGLVGGLIIWAYGAWWLLLAAAMTLTHLPGRLPFNMGWWGFTFPFGVFILATNALAGQTHLRFFADTGRVCLGIFICLWLLVAARTLAGAYRGHLFAGSYTSPPIH